MTSDKLKEYARTLMGMSLDFVQGGLDDETFKANVKLFNNVLNPETSVATDEDQGVAADTQIIDLQSQISNLSANYMVCRADRDGLRKENTDLLAELERLRGEREAPQWISVNDRLPETDGIYHCICEDEPALMQIIDGEIRQVRFCNGGVYTADYAPKDYTYWTSKPSDHA